MLQPYEGNGLIDEAYWENYQSNTEAYVLRAQRLLSPLAAATKSKHALVFPGTVSLLSETNCCAQPCASARCSDCGTYSLAYREEISFCSQNKLPGGLGSHSKHMNVEYMLDTLEEGRKQLFDAGYAPLMGPLGMYNYRGLRILLEGTDVLGDPVCPKL